MRARVVAAAVALSVVAAAPAGGLVIGAPLTASGHVRYETSSGRYHLPTIGPFQFLGPVVHDGEVVALRLDGDTATLDTATMTFPRVSLRSPNERVQGTCDVPYSPALVGAPHEQLILRCVARVDGGGEQRLDLAVQSVGVLTSGDPVHGLERVTHDGVFLESPS
jgi:hypothetical protein